MNTVIEQIPTQPGMGRSLIHYDDASRSFRAAAALPDTAEPRSKVWRRGGAYDQGQTPWCVPNTGKGVLNSSPLSARVDYDTRSEYPVEQWYHGAQANDEWPSNDYDGTSGLGMCRWLKQQGLIREYRWNFTLYEVLLSLSHVGPVGFGTWWWSGMFFPDERGVIRPTGRRDGGHEVELMGVDLPREEVIGMNSWGTQWGDRGRFRLSFADLEKLLLDGGDAFVITG